MKKAHCSFLQKALWLGYESFFDLKHSHGSAANASCRTQGENQTERDNDQSAINEWRDPSRLVNIFTPAILAIFHFLWFCKQRCLRLHIT